MKIQPSLFSRRPACGFNFVESLVALATIAVLAVIMIPVVKIYVFGEKLAGSDEAGRAKLEVKSRGTYEMRFSEDENPDQSSPETTTPPPAPETP